MFRLTLSVIIFSLLFTSNTLIFAQKPNVTSSDTNLWVNVVVGINGTSAFQCWSMKPPYAVSSEPGDVGTKIQALGNVKRGNIAMFDDNKGGAAGLHNAPAAQWVIVTRGAFVISLPSTGASMYIPAGQIIIVADIAEVSKAGHYKAWTAGAAAIQLPFAGGIIPDHTVVNSDGLCSNVTSDNMSSTFIPVLSLPRHDSG